jgi:hypothetical protein
MLQRWLKMMCCIQGVTNRCRLSWLTNSALVYEPKCGRGVSQPMYTWSPNKLWRSNSIFNLWLYDRNELREEKERCERLETDLCTSTREAKSLRYSPGILDSFHLSRLACYTCGIWASNRFLRPCKRNGNFCFVICFIRLSILYSVNENCMHF